MATERRYHIRSNSDASDDAQPMRTGVGSLHELKPRMYDNGFSHVHNGFPDVHNGFSEEYS